MNTKCAECGAVFSTGDAETAKNVLAKHVANEHGSAEARFKRTLSKCHVIITATMAGQKVSKAVLRDALNEVSDLLKIPRQETEVTHAVGNVPKTVSSAQDVVPAETATLGGNAPKPAV